MQKSASNLIDVIIEVRLVLSYINYLTPGHS